MPFELSPAVRQRLDAATKRYPEPMAACLPALYIAQAEAGALSDDVVRAVADYLKLSHAHVFGVLSFYTMFHRREPGRCVLRVCSNVSCMLRGAAEILAAFGDRLGVKPGETTADGAFTLVEEECLAACAGAPAMVCGDRYFLDLRPEQVGGILAELREHPRPEALP